MSKPAMNVSLGDCCERLLDGFEQSFDRPRLGLSQKSLDLRPASLNRVEVRRIGSQANDLCSTRRDQFFNPCDLVCREIVPQHDVTGLQCGCQNLAHPQAKDVARDGSLHDPRSTDAFHSQGGHQGVVVAAVVRHRINDARAWGSTAVEARHCQICARLIDESQPREVESLHRFTEFGAQLLDALSVALSRVDRLFFNGSWSRCNSRQMVAGLTRGPLAATTRSRNSESVASGCWSTSRRRSSEWSVSRRRWPPALG